MPHGSGTREALMNSKPFWLGSALVLGVLVGASGAKRTSTLRAQAGDEDPIKTLVGRLNLDRYKSDIKGLTQFGDRRQGTDRNRSAVDWIEAQLKTYGCPT